MRKLTEALTNIVVEGYMENPEVRKRVDDVISEHAPDDIKRMGVIRKVQWILEELKGAEFVRAHLAKQKEG